MSVVELEQVGVRYREIIALGEVDTVVGQGEVVAVLGPNGAGKSTLFEVVVGLVRPTTGSARVLGSAPGGARHSVGAMLQHAGLPDQVSVEELVRLVGRSYPTALLPEAVLDRVGLTAKRDRTVGVLSGGERQRLLLAMAIIGEPSLLVLDEPTAAMDLEARASFWERARASVGDGATLLFATHDLAEADAVADRVLVLRGGRLIADAPPAVLKQQVPGVVVSLATDAPSEVVAAWDGIDRVEAMDDGPPEGGARGLRIWADVAENVVVPLVDAGYRMDRLSVSEADLEDALAQLAEPSVPPMTRPLGAVR